MKSDLAEQIEQAAAVLRTFGAKEVYVFGSAATGTLDDDSDVDMAVCGVPPSVFFRAWARAVRAFPGREMDLIDLDGQNRFGKFLKEKGSLRRVA